LDRSTKEEASKALLSLPWGGEISREQLIAITKDCDLIWIKFFDPLSNQGYFDSGSKIAKDWPARGLGRGSFI
jgi:hypothetical protein